MPYPIERILCPTDFSDFSTLAFRHALALTRRFGARLKVLHVVPRVVPMRDAPFVETSWLNMVPESHRYADEEMHRFLELAREARVDHEIENRAGEPWREILAAANDMPADLVVLGTHGRSGFEHLFLGSVTEKLIPRLPCPVLTVGREEGRSWEAPGLVTRILCATDFSSMSAEALRFSLTLARADHAEVTLLNVIEDVPAMGEPTYFSVPELEPLRKEHERLAAERLRKAIAEVTEPGSTILPRTVVGRAYKEILRIAVEVRADAIVLGAQGHGPLEHLIFGSNALHVVRRASCPVFIVRPLSPRPKTAEARPAALTTTASGSAAESKDRKHTPA
jgi:nucleotide-binding universal stress UspA family protein